MAPGLDPEAFHDVLDKHRDSVPADLQHYYLTLDELRERKLWHELTDTLEEYYRLPASGPHRLPLYNEFIATFSGKINQLKLVALALEAATQCKDESERLKFLQRLATTVNKPESQDAFVSAQSSVASIKLQTGDIEGAQKDLAQCEKILDSFDSVEISVNAAFYGVNSDLYKAKKDFAGYYKNTLLYLACIDVNDLAQKERQIRAHDLSMAALLSESIYNFGELLMHPILDSLRKTSREWLVELLFAFNRGDLAAFEKLLPHIMKDQLLSENQQFLHQKISLAALTETVFRRPPHDRAMTFAEIRDETKVQLDEIEHLIMKALSLGLLRGTIDQVGQVANINWVQPKVLDMKQIEAMRERLREWDSSVNQLGTWIEGVGKEVWAA